MKKCIICGNEMQPYKLKQLVRCSQCDYVCADCQLENRQLAALYDKNFWGGQIIQIMQLIRKFIRVILENGLRNY